MWWKRPFCFPFGEKTFFYLKKIVAFSMALVRKSSSKVINPRRACAARVTVVGSVCLLPNISLIECLFVPQMIRLTLTGNDGQKICGVFSENAPLNEQKERGKIADTSMETDRGFKTHSVQVYYVLGRLRVYMFNVCNLFADAIFGHPNGADRNRVVLHSIKQAQVLDAESKNATPEKLALALQQLLFSSLELAKGNCTRPMLQQLDSERLWAIYM